MKGTAPANEWIVHQYSCSIQVLTFHVFPGCPPSTTNTFVAHCWDAKQQLSTQQYTTMHLPFSLAILEPRISMYIYIFTINISQKPQQLAASSSPLQRLVADYQIAAEAFSNVPSNLCMNVSMFQRLTDRVYCLIDSKYSLT